MQAFKGDKKLKKMLLDEIVRHRKADLLRQGSYKTKIDGKFRFCAVGCAIETLNVKLGKDYSNNNHNAYETELDIPSALAYLEDRIFEKLPKEKAMVWPEHFIAAIPVGADLSLVVPKLVLWIMDDVKKHAKKNPQILKAIQTVRELYRKKIKGEIITNDEWSSARRNATATYAAAAAATATYAAAATDTAAYAAAATYATADAARKQQWVRTSKQLIFLLKNSMKKLEELPK